MHSVRVAELRWLESCIVTKLQSGRAREVHGLELQSCIISELQSPRVAEASQTRIK